MIIQTFPFPAKPIKMSTEPNVSIGISGSVAYCVKLLNESSALIEGMDRSQDERLTEPEPRALNDADGALVFAKEQLEDAEKELVWFNRRQAFAWPDVGQRLLARLRYLDEKRRIKEKINSHKNVVSVLEKIGAERRQRQE